MAVETRTDEHGREVMSPGGDFLHDHVVGDISCTAGWCGGQGYPKACEEPECAGLVHADFGDEDASGDYWCYTKCDVCGERE